MITFSPIFKTCIFGFSIRFLTISVSFVFLACQLWPWSIVSLKVLAVLLAAPSLEKSWILPPDAVLRPCRFGKSVTWEMKRFDRSVAFMMNGSCRAKKTSVYAMLTYWGTSMAQDTSHAKTLRRLQSVGNSGSMTGELTFHWAIWSVGDCPL